MLILSFDHPLFWFVASLSRRKDANSQLWHIGTKVIAYNPRRRCGRKRVGVSNLVPVSSWSDEDTIEQGPGVWIVRGEDEEERP